MPATGSDHWNSPARIAELICRFNGRPPRLDPCSNTRSIMRAELEWYGPPKSNGIVLPWAATIRTGNKLAYVNPPYSSKAIWLRRCLEEARAGMEVIALVPADTDTAHWYLYCTTAATRRCFLRTRLVHTGVKSEPEPARFPSVLVYWQPERDNQRIRRFHDVFTPEGWVV